MLTIAGAVVSATVKSTLQVELLPEPSVTVMVTGCGPNPTRVPAVGFWVMLSARVGVQLSVATTCEAKLGTAAWQLLSAEAVTEAGQVPAGGVVSATTTVTLA